MNSLNDYLKPRTGSGRWLWAGLMLSCACAAYSAFALDALSSRTNQTKQEAARLREPPRPTQRVSKVDEERNAQWEKLAVERNFGWYPVFHALEKASQEDIELLEFRPDKVNRQLSLRGEARDMKALVDYLGRLSEQPVVRRAYLVHQKATQRGSLPILEFEVHALLAGPG